VTQTAAEALSLYTPDVLGVFGLKDEEILGCLGMAVENGKLHRRLPSLRAESPSGYLIAWPDTGCGVMALVAKGQDRTNPWLESGWPFVMEDGAEPFRVEQVTLSDDGLQAVVGGRWRGLALSFFDVTGRAREIAQTAMILPVAVSCWALRAEQIDREPLRLDPDRLQPDVRAALSEGIDAAGELEIHMDGFATFSPADAGPSPLFHACGRIDAVRSLPCALEGVVLWSCGLTVRRDIDTGRETQLTVHISNAVWPEGAPEPGQTLETLVWVQGVIETGSG